MVSPFLTPTDHGSEWRACALHFVLISNHRNLLLAGESVFWVGRMALAAPAGQCTTTGDPLTASTHNGRRYSNKKAPESAPRRTGLGPAMFPGNQLYVIQRLVGISAVKAVAAANDVEKVLAPIGKSSCRLKRAERHGC